jgi:hypothetical protein
MRRLLFLLVCLVTTGTATTIVRNGHDRTWWLDASAASQLRRGPAEACAVAVVHRTDGTTHE